MREGTNKNFPATGITFTSTDNPKDVPVIALVFETWKTATACYDILIDNFEKEDLYINFTDIQENEIEFEILKSKNNEWIVDARLPFNKKDFEQFCYYVDSKGRYAVLFGFLNDDGNFIVCPSVSKPESIKTFLGYKK